MQIWYSVTAEASPVPSPTADDAVEHQDLELFFLGEHQDLKWQRGYPRWVLMERSAPRLNENSPLPVPVPALPK